MRPTPATMLVRPCTWHFPLVGSNGVDGNSVPQRRTGLVFTLLKGCGGHWSSLRLDDVNKLLLKGVVMYQLPAAGAIFILLTDKMLGLVPIDLPFQQPVCPEALIADGLGTGR